MASTLMTEDEALALHFGYFPPAGGVRWFSGFVGALRDARRMTGRNQDTAAKGDENLLGSWLGTLGYMALLDQIGKCFKPRTAAILQARPGRKLNEIERALRYFASLSLDHIDALLCVAVRLHMITACTTSIRLHLT